MKNLKKISYLSFFAVLFLAFLAASAAAQTRPRMVVKTISSLPVNRPPASRPAATDTTKSLSSSIPAHNASIKPAVTTQVAGAPEIKQPLIKKTASSTPVTAANTAATARTAYSSTASAELMDGIQSRLGIPYRYGSSGPQSYDCSGFVWAAFKDAGLNFDRTTARALWAMSEPVSGDDRYKFGTLVFFNDLGHMGIVADEKGFYQASSSKGITYSKFEGYWEKRIVGFKRLPIALPAPADKKQPAQQIKQDK